MKSVFYFLLGLFLLLSVGGRALASEATIEQKAELLNLVIDVNHAVKNGNFSVISHYMPDHLYKEIARRLDTTEDKLRHNFINQLHDKFKGLPAGSYHLDENNIEYFQTGNGTFYALIPTFLETKDRLIKYKTLAIFDKAQWYLIYGGQKTVQNPVFLEIYPDFSNVHLSREIITKK
ncbi:hypothetical protein ABID23_000503 [Bartonella silvatica]|uniref:Uncharacterized protein n=1 Tax=Bartonella silvatica TaxID=357760 RepID=A0ABV2HFW3_9HYPH